MRVVVLGASGTIGRALLPALNHEHEVVAVSRRPRAAQSGWTHWAVADASDAASVRPVLEGTEVVYYLVHSLDWPGFTGRFNLASVAVALVAGWLSASLLVGVLYRAFSPGRSGSARWPWGRPSPGRSSPARR